MFYNVRERAKKEASAGGLKKEIVEGLLICGKIADGTEGLIEMSRSAGIKIWEWHYLLRTAETLHREFLDIVKDRARVKSPDDPRIKALEETDNTNEE